MTGGFEIVDEDLTRGTAAELATAYVMLADPLSSYTSGTTIAVTGGKPFM